MQLTLLPGIDLVIEVVDDKNSTHGHQKWEVKGPEAKLAMLCSLADHVPNKGKAGGRRNSRLHKFDGLLSPRSKVTLPAGESREAAGVPEDAHSFAFTYPTSDMEEILESLNLADEPWGFFLLVGGFLFFDRAGALLPGTACALTLVPSRWMLHFDGPHTPSADAIKTMRHDGRMCDVTLDALEDAGFAAFGWAHAKGAACERPMEQRGIFVSDSYGVQYPHGGFVYEMRNAAPGEETAFFALVPHTPEQLKEFKDSGDRSGKRTGGVLSRLGSWLGRDYELRKKERGEMNKLTRHHSESSLHGGGGKANQRPPMERWWRFTKLQIRYLSPLIFVLLSTTSLITLAYLHKETFELASTLLWYAVFTYTAWVPIRDTAALAVLATAKKIRRRTLTGLLVGVPLLAVALNAVTMWVPLGSSAIAATIADETARNCGVVLIYLAMPICIYLLRRTTANDLVRRGGRGHGTTAARDTYLVAGAVSKIVTNVPMNSSSSAAPPPPKAPAAGHDKAAGAIGSWCTPPIQQSPAAAAAAPTAVSLSVPQGLQWPAARTRYTGGLILSENHLKLLSYYQPVARIMTPRRKPSTRVVPVDATYPPAPTLPRPMLGQVSQDTPTRLFNDATRAANVKRRWAAARLHAHNSVRGGGMKRQGTMSKLIDVVTKMRKKSWTGQHLFSKEDGKMPNAEAKTRKAATRLQAQIRAHIARKHFRAELAVRRASLIAFSWPIFLASLIDILGGTAFRVLVTRGILSEWPYGLVSLAFAVPSFIVAFKDLRGDSPPRFSLAHCIFFVGCLYRLSFQAAQIDSLVLQRLTFVLQDANVGSFSALVNPITLTMICHFALFITVTMLGKLSLTLVSTKNACTHLLFPFQFFDFLFLYVFFSLRSVEDDLTWSWGLQQAFLQINIMMRNSGTTDALLRRHFGKLIQCILRQNKFQKAKAEDDPLFRLQFLARIAVQYDLADLTAMVATPAIVSFIIWRDGHFALEGSGLLVRSCDIGSMLRRFGFLLVVKPIASLLARMALKRAMRKTLLGKPTIHGVSPLAARLIAERRLVKSKAGGVGSDEQLHKEFDLTKEELQVVKEDLSLSGLNFRVLRRKLLNRSSFFAAVAVLQCFAAFPVRRTPQAAHVWAFNRELQNNLTIAITASSVNSTIPACPMVYEGWQWLSCSEHRCWTF